MDCVSEIVPAAPRMSGGLHVPSVQLHSFVRRTYISMGIGLLAT